LETVISAKARGTFTFTVVFVTFGKLLTFKCWEETIETIPVSEVEQGE
jgi:hypothetical protein